MKGQRYVFGRLQVEIHEMNTGQIKYTFSGSFDEAFAYDGLPAQEIGRVVIDLEKVESINSVGVREWTSFIERFGNKAEIFFENCSVAMVDQFNIVPQAMGKGQIVSFFAPYYCPSCEQEVNQFVETSKHLADLMTKKAPDFLHQCGTELEFDAIEDCYFHQIERNHTKIAS